MEQHGRPAVTLVTEAFEAAAVARAAALGLPDHPRVATTHCDHWSHGNTPK
jgi:hypothetical protein